MDLELRRATLTVTDNGPGFDPAQRERLFRPFFTTKTGGTGLGLALTQKIIVTHNGGVTASLAEHGGRAHGGCPATRAGVARSRRIRSYELGR